MTTTHRHVSTPSHSSYLWFSQKQIFTSTSQQIEQCILSFSFSLCSSPFKPRDLLRHLPHQLNLLLNSVVFQQLTRPLSHSYTAPIPKKHFNVSCVSCTTLKRLIWMSSWFLLHQRKRSWRFHFVNLISGWKNGSNHFCTVFQLIHGLSSAKSVQLLINERDLDNYILRIWSLSWKTILITSTLFFSRCKV